MPRKIAIVGGGGFAREVLDIVDAVNAAGKPNRMVQVVGVFDDGSPNTDLLRTFGIDNVGAVADVLKLPVEVETIVAIANPATRRRLVDTLRGRRFGILVHPTATVGRAVTLGEGSIICAHVSLANHIDLGAHTQVGANSAVGHDVVTRGACTISPMVAVSGNVMLDDEVFVGTGATIRQGHRIGRGTVIGSGAAVVADFGEDQVVTGVPGRARVSDEHRDVEH